MPKNPCYASDAETQPRARDRRLPGLHDVLGDVLEQPLRSYALHDYPERKTTPYYDKNKSYSPHLAPLMPFKQRASTPLNNNSVTQVPVAQSQHAYHLFNYSPNQGLVHQRSSTQEQDLEPANPRPRLPPSDPSRKYVCADCGNRFSKHSTLRNHLLTHSGEKPFECTFPNCGRRFSMACNMQRHLRTHTSASAFDPGADHEMQPQSRASSVQPPYRTDSRGSSRGDSPRDDSSRSYYKR